LSRRDSVTIARRFNAGNAEAAYSSPEGTAESTSITSSVSRPFGTGPSVITFPGVETPGYSHLSLRDKTFTNFRTRSGPGGYQISHGEKFGFRWFGGEERRNQQSNFGHGLNTDGTQKREGERPRETLTTPASPRMPKMGLARTLALPLKRNPCLIRV